MAANDESKQRTRALWKSSLISAFRTSLACTIVAIITLYGPPYLKTQITFPAFSYVTVILIIINASLGDTIRSCWLALYATIQTICPAMLCLWIIGPTNLTTISTSLVLAVSAFFVALPEWTHLVAKRIALGQLVIVYVVGYIKASDDGNDIDAVMHPIHVAASTAIGVVACVLAMLLPYPQLAGSEVKQNCHVFAENASERVKLFVKAFFAENKSSLMSQAKSLGIKGSKALHCIKAKQESVVWERLPIRFFKPYCKNPGDRFQELERLVRGMEMALITSSLSYANIPNINKNMVITLQEKVSLNLQQIKLPACTSSFTVHESRPQNSINLFQTLEPFLLTPTDQNALPTFFFLFCLHLLHKESRTSCFAATSKTEASASMRKQEPVPSKQQTKIFSKWIQPNWPTYLTQKRLIPAIKCSLSLGLAVFLGLKYSKEDGYWSGLPVAITLAASREATFKVANIKAQGTVIGTVYGVIGCFLFERFVDVRFVALFPWFVFTSFLQRSRMYSQAGAVSAVIGAVLILGRKNFGTPSDFAIARIVETFIGLSCSIFVELLFQPKRAATSAKVQLTKCLSTLQNCLNSSVDIAATSETGLFEVNLNKLKGEVAELKIFVEEAGVEPNFWFVPFHTACYNNLLKSLSKMTDLFLFTTQAVGFLHKQKHRVDAEQWNQGIDMLDDDLQLFNKITGSYIEYFQGVTSIKSLAFLDNEIEKGNIDFSGGDIELGGTKSDSSYQYYLLDQEGDMEKLFMSSFLEHLQTVVGLIEDTAEEEETKGEIVLCLSAIGYCITSMMKEVRVLEKEVKELIQWENPTSEINLSEISHKIHALQNNI